MLGAHGGSGWSWRCCFWHPLGALFKPREGVRLRHWDMRLHQELTSSHPYWSSWCTDFSKGTKGIKGLKRRIHNSDCSCFFSSLWESPPWVTQAQMELLWRLDPQICQRIRFYEEWRVELKLFSGTFSKSQLLTTKSGFCEQRRCCRLERLSPMKILKAHVWEQWHGYFAVRLSTNNS